MSAIGLWYPVYDRTLAWVGVSLETDASVFVSQDFFDQMSSKALAVDGVEGKLFFVGADVLGACKQPLQLPFPPSRLVAVLGANFLSAATSMPVFRAWHDKKVRLAVAGLTVPAGLTRDMVSAHVFDATTLRQSFGEKALLDASRSGAKLLVQGIGSMKLFEWCAKAGFGYFTFGELDAPEYGDQPKDPSRLPMMRLLSLIAADAETPEIEEVFKLDPKLAFGLLKLVNSASFGTSKEITSFGQAILLLGRRQLQRWLQLLMFSLRKDGDDSPNILMQRAAERGKMMELLSQGGKEKSDAEHAFMVGVFSVLDILIQTPLEKLLESVSLPQPVEDALLERKGRLGALLDLVCATERRDFAEVQRHLSGMGIAPEQLSRFQLDAIFWALKVAGTR
jgi:EAL and modified HD-GYP domain-containing signal transduction protein